MKHFEKIIAIAMLVFAIGFNLWLYRLEPTATIDPNDNTFQFALVDRTNQIWDFAQQSCAKEKGKRQTEKGVFGLTKFPFTFCLYQFTFLFDHWVPNWAQGYNLPFYYSHIPQIIIVTTYKVVSGIMYSVLRISQQCNNAAMQQCVFSLFTYYHWIIYLLLSFFPLSLFLALRVVRLSWLSAGIGALLASHISTDGFYGLDSPSFLWRGYGLSSQLFAMIWLPLAIAYAYRYFTSEQRNERRRKFFDELATLFWWRGGMKFSQFARPAQHKKAYNMNDRGNNRNAQEAQVQRAAEQENFRHAEPGIFWSAVFFLTATTAGHLGIGLIALLSLIPFALAEPIMTLFHCHTVTLSYQQCSNVAMQQLKKNLVKLIVLGIMIIFFLSYWIVPIVLTDNYHNFSFWDPVWKFNSYGWKEVLTRLLSGDLFDFGRFPLMTILIFVGLFASLKLKFSGNVTPLRAPSAETAARAEQGYAGKAIQQFNPSTSLRASNSDNDPVEKFPSYFSLSILFIFWLVLYFGRTTWGSLLDLIPGVKEFHQSRFIVGIHLAGLFLAPIGLSWLINHLVSLLCHFFQLRRILPIQQSPPRIVALLHCYIVTSTIAVGLAIILYPRTIEYAKHNDRLIRQANESHSKVKADEDALFSSIRALPPGRVFAGRGGWWGKDFRVAETPYYMNLSTYGIPTVLWLPETWSPNSDIEQYFSEDQLKDYILFGIRYVAAPPSQKPQPFWKLITERPTWKLYEIVQKGSTLQTRVDPSGTHPSGTQNGYITTGVRPAVVSTDKYSYANVVRLWIQSDAHVNGLYPELTFSKEYPKTTGLPNFKMLDEVTYKVPDGSIHNVFQEQPWYQNTTNTTNQQILPIIKSETNDSDMIFAAKIDVPENCVECIVVLKQSFHPNWRTAIDGKSAQAFTVFPFFTAVPVGKGSHNIVFSYEPSRLKMTLLVIELLVISVLIVMFLRMKVSQARVLPQKKGGSSK